jgi:hypothetical protein
VQQRNHISNLESRYAQLRVENRQLNEQVKRLSDASELEALARQRLGLVRPGEKAYFVDPVKPKSTPAPRTDERTSWWESAWDSFTALLRGRR